MLFIKQIFKTNNINHCNKEKKTHGYLLSYVDINWYKVTNDSSFFYYNINYFVGTSYTSSYRRKILKLQLELRRLVTNIEN